MKKIIFSLLMVLSLTNCSDDFLGYNIRIAVSGIAGTATLNRTTAAGTNTYTLSADGTYQLSGTVAGGDTYTFTVTSPSGQTCTLSSGGGTINSDLTLTLLCASSTFTVGGVVNGLRSGSTITLLINGYLSKTVSANGVFTFDDSVASASSADVSVSTGIGYACTVYDGSSTSLTANMTNAMVTCEQVNTLYAYGTHDGSMGGRNGADALCDGTLSGAASQNNCSNDAAFLSFSAADEIRDLPDTYAFNTNKNIYDTPSHKISGNWAGLLDGRIDHALAIEEDVWSGSNSDGSVSVYTCQGWTTNDSTITAEYGIHGYINSNWITFNNVWCHIRNNINLLCLCMQNGSQVGGTVANLAGTLKLTLNGSEEITVLGNNPFFFGTSLNAGDSYAVAVSSQPTGQTCTIASASGTLSTTAAQVAVICITYGTTTDTDGDGILNTVEETNSLVPLVNSQGTVLMTTSNVAAYRGGTTSFKMPTGIVKMTAGLSSTSADATGDLDGDGVTNATELTNGTNLFVAASTGTLGSATTVSAGSTLVQKIATGDFNGDGDLDLVTEGAGGTNEGYIILGSTGSTFGTATTLTLDANPTSVAVADFDADGDMDVAFTLTTVGAGGDSVSVYLNNGSGTFTKSANYTTGESPNDIAVGDWNGDGKMDLAVTDRGDNTDNTTLSIFLGNGDGTFAARTSVTTNAGPNYITAGDFNGDGKLDLAVTHRGFNGTGNTFSVFIGDGSGGFGGKTDYTTGAAPGGITTGDFNADGFLDIAVANTGATDNGSTASIFLNNGDGTFALGSTLTTGTGPVGIVTFDVDGDNDLDLLVANTEATDGSTLSRFLGNGNGTFGNATNISVGSAPIHMAVGDFDRDGDLDVANSNFASGNITVLTNQ